MAVADSMGIKKPKNIIDQVNDAVQSWDRWAKETEVNSKLRKSVKSTLIKI